MAVDAATIATTPTSAPATTTSSSNNSSSSSSTSGATLADNFQSFLMLLTTQLQNQNPLDPLDTNQFTQQLVQFASVEQQINMNTQLSTLVAMQKATQNTQAMSFLGATATVDGATAQLVNAKATWEFSSDKPASGNIIIKNSTGQTVYSGTFPISAGEQAFQWDGRSSTGQRGSTPASSPIPAAPACRSAAMVTTLTTTTETSRTRATRGP